MKKIFYATVFLFCVLNSFAQQQPSPSQQLLISVKGDTIPDDGVDPATIKPDVDSKFPGGDTAWLRFLQKNLRYPHEAIDKEIQGIVILQFIVCTDGTVCNVQAVSGPKILRKAAIETFKKTPGWKPAELNGQKVKTLKRQAISFKLSE